MTSALRLSKNLRSAFWYIWMAGTYCCWARYTLAKLIHASGMRQKPSVAAEASWTCKRRILTHAGECI